MTTFRHLPGSVYILVNNEINRVKVGMTINNVEDRLVDVNRKWRGKNATCQICGGRRLVDRKGRMPKHVISGSICRGSSFLPLEKDSALATSYLKLLKEKHKSLSGSELGSNTKRIKTLEERIKRYEELGKPKGRWSVSTVYYTDSAEEVELETHKVLSEFLDKSMPFGEVFSCSVAKARESIELIIDKLGYSKSASKDIYRD